jgi:hypothetical protein
LREAFREALEDDELKQDLCKHADALGFEILSKSEIQNLKLEARRRGKEEALAEAPKEKASDVKATIDKDWEDAQEQIPGSLPTGKWTPIPRQVTLAGQVVCFDLRMRILKAEVVAVPPKTKAKRVRKRAASATVSAPPTVDVSTPATTPVTTPSDELPVKDLFIGESSTTSAAPIELD